MRKTTALLAGLFYSSFAAAEGFEDTIAGDWGGVRTDMEEHGYSVESVLTLEGVGLSHGGIKRGVDSLLNYDLTLTVDSEKAGLWSNGTFFLYFLGDAGNNPTGRVGDLQGTSNIESPDDFKLYQIWYEHSFLDGKVTWLNGLHDLNSEFDHVEASTGLFNGSFGMQPDMSQTGVSIFPITGMASRIKILPTEGSYALAALYDGLPGDPNDEKGTHVQFNSGDGLFTVGEAGVTSEDKEHPYKAGLGSWYKSTRYADFAGVDREHNWGWYFISEYTLFRESDSEQGLTAFVQYGHADPGRNEIANYLGAGLQYAGLLPDRDDDIASFGIAQARHGEGFKSQFPEFDSAETVLELNYRVSVSPGFSLQPDFQYVINPGTDAEVKDAAVVALRMQLNM